MKQIHELFNKPKRPETVIQFGEGGFLRGFANWMMQKANDGGLEVGSTVVVQPIEQGMCDKLEEQDCLYTHIIRGTEGVETSVIDVISRCVNPYTDYKAYLKLAHNPDFKVIVSNTTEAGITYRPEDQLSDTPPKSFPAKLTALLYERYQTGFGGFLILPCELIEHNGSKLKEYVLRYANDWDLGDGFINWIGTENHFCNTLVDRIVTGFPKGEDISLPYVDNMLNTSEYFHLWVIEGEQSLSDRFPLDKAGLHVLWTDDLQKYRTRKVRILNGAHTSLVPYAMLKGFDTVKSCMDDEQMLSYIKKCVFDEIIPTLDLPKEELLSYANSVLERFSNPYIKHYLSSIALNSVSKFKVRVLPSILEYKKRFGTLPETLLFSFAALIAFYKTDMANDDADVLEIMKQSTAKEILANKELWGEDLSFLYEKLSKLKTEFSI